MQAIYCIKYCVEVIRWVCAWYGVKRNGERSADTITYDSEEDPGSASDSCLGFGSPSRRR